MREIDRLRCLGEDCVLAAHVLVAFLEGLQGGDGAALEAELALQRGPVDLEGSASLSGGAGGGG